MKNRLEVRGVIVPSHYDEEWAKSYIDRGIITPESRLRTSLSSIDKKQGCELYINSPGGSIFAGCEMINALNAWAVETGQPIEITIGAMAASMAAVMMVNVNAAKVKAYKNTKIMFHGAMTDTQGGEGAHKDAAELLARINGDLMATLVARYNLPPEQVAEWFAEGRMGWLTAEAECGMVSEIIDAEDKPAKIPKNATAMLSERGLKLAAALTDELVDVSDVPEIKNEVQSENGKPEEVVAEVAEGITLITVQSFIESAQGGDAKDGAGGGATGNTPAVELPRSGDVAELTDKLIATEHERRQWQAKFDQSQADMTKIKAEFGAQISALSNDLTQRDSRIAGLESRLTRLTLQAVTLHHEPVVADWPGALCACNGDYVQARSKYPAVFAEFMKQANQNKHRR